jgi:Zn-dependent protease
MHRHLWQACPVEPAPPPRWTFPVWGPRVRVSAGLVLWTALAAALAAQYPGSDVPVSVLAFMGALVGSMAVHEGAHAVAAHSLGYRVDWVVIGGFAGVTAYAGRTDRPLERAAVALAGPAASAALVLALFGVRATLADETVAMAMVEFVIVLNTLAVVVNLVPIGRTDGALVIRGLFHHAREARQTRGAEPRPRDPAV